MPMYPAAMSSLPQPFMVPGRWLPTRITAAVLCFFGLVLVIAAIFVPLYSGVLTLGGTFGPAGSLEMTFTPWSVEYDVPDMNVAGEPEGVPRLGYPIVFSAVLLLCAAVACWYAATPSAGRGAGRMAGVLTAVSGAFLIGTVWTIALLVTNAVDTIILFGTMNEGLSTEATYLVGYWFLLIASLLVFAGAVFALLPARQPEWQSPHTPVNPFLATPPYGIAVPRPGAPDMPVVHALPMAPMSPVQPSVPQPYTYSVDPLTGQPLHAPTVDPLTGRPTVQGPLGPPLAPSPPAGIPVPDAQVMPFTPEPVPSANGAQPAEPPPVVLPPIVLPDAPPLPETPPGPAIPAGEDPLAEPPRN
jgi:hypothetical protein